ncbi:MAG: hypothetical protein ACR2KK_07870 [Acidimicrobiales bacterium]
MKFIGSVLPVAGRVGVVAGRDGVAVTDLTVGPVDADLAAALVADDVLGSLLGLGLGGVVVGIGAL